MVYGLIPKVRSLAGVSAVFEHNLRIGVGDGSTTVFQIPSVGNRQFYFVDKDAGIASTIEKNTDVIAYDNGSIITITDLSLDSGKITLTSAPANSHIITSDYLHSEISDSAVLQAMDIAMEMTDLIIRGKNADTENYTQTEDANGIDYIFVFDHADVHTVNTVTVNGETKILNTDYFLYKYKRNSVRYWYIRFKTRPFAKEQSIVINYDYGAEVKGITRMAELFAARYILLEIKPSRTAGMWKKGERNAEKSDVSRLQQLNNEIKMLKSKYDRRIKYEVS